MEINEGAQLEEMIIWSGERGIHRESLSNKYGISSNFPLLGNPTVIQGDFLDTALGKFPFILHHCRSLPLLFVVAIHSCIHCSHHRGCCPPCMGDWWSTWIEGATSTILTQASGWASCLCRLNTDISDLKIQDVEHTCESCGNPCFWPVHFRSVKSTLKS